MGEKPERILSSALLIVVAAFAALAGAGSVLVLRPNATTTVIYNNFQTVTTFEPTTVSTTITEYRYYTQYNDWGVVYSYSGSGSIDTVPFHIQSSLWRVTYTVTPSSSYLTSLFYLYAVRATDPYYNHVAYVSFIQQQGTATTYVPFGPGDFYLHIVSNYNKYTITVEAKIS